MGSRKSSQLWLLQPTNVGYSSALSLLASRLLGLLLLRLGGLGRCPPPLLIRAGRRSDLWRLYLSGRGGGLALAGGSGLLGGLGWGFLLVLRGGGGNLLQLLGNGILVIDGISLSSGLLELWHGDMEVLGVLKRLLIAHVLGQGVAVLVGVNTSIVEAQVVLVGIVPALLLLRGHVSPSSLALFLDSALGSIGAKVVGNDGAGMLHVEEVGGQGTLRGVGVVSALLALLLLLNEGGHVWDARHHELGSGILKRVEKIALGALSSALAEQKVSLANVVIGEGPQKLQNSGESANSLIEISC